MKQTNHGFTLSVSFLKVSEEGLITKLWVLTQYHYWYYVLPMAKIDKMLRQIKETPQNVRFIDLCKVCEYYFGNPRQTGSSHRVYKTPWQGDPRVNIQNNKGKAKAYQVKQVLRAIERLEVNYDSKK
jgi:hypothetical protein